jgi:purine-binding chemotaxis protein CheW
MSRSASIVGASADAGFVSLTVAGQLFGAPVLRVQDVIAETAISCVPLAPPEIAGSLNLRGRIVTAVDLRRRLGLPPRPEGDGFMCVTVERGGELYALLVDDVGDVLWLEPERFEPAPVTLPRHWRTLCDGLYRLEEELLLVLDIDQVLALGPGALAA